MKFNIFKRSKELSSQINKLESELKATFIEVRLVRAEIKRLKSASFRHEVLIGQRKDIKKI